MRYKISSLLGWLFIAVGLVCNPWVLAWFFSPDGNIENIHSRLSILLFEILMILWGILTLKKKSELIINLNLLLVTTFVIIPLLGEAILRLGIALNIKEFRVPSHYASYHSDNDFWKLEQDWSPQHLYAPPERVHPLLGWSQENITKNNPLGLQENTLERLKTVSPILFYGDSFLKGLADKEFQIPEYMNEKIGRVNVADLGVGGYGMDQIYLMFKETYPQAANPTVIVGILANDDLDRVALSIRTSQKPYFRFDKMGPLRLTGIPIEKDQEKYFRNYSLSIRSYLFALLKQKYFNADSKMELKKKMNFKLLESFKRETDTKKTPLLFVLFYGQKSLTQVDWQEEFLKNTMTQLGLHYIDTKKLLLQYAAEKHLEVSSFYVMENGHHNNLGNRIIAEGIIDYLKANHYIE